MAQPKIARMSVKCSSGLLKRLCCAVEAEDDKALLMLLDKRCAELVEGKAALQVRCDELQGDLDACLDTLETDRTALTDSQTLIHQLQVCLTLTIAQRAANIACAATSCRATWMPAWTP